jgi:geranylgeranyl reductase family protein
MNRHVSDVVIVGGGPAGCTTARRLAARGHEVVVLEEHREMGVPVHCTGLLGLEAFDEFDLPRETILGHASSARFWAGDRTSALIGSDRVRAAVIERTRFDQRLAEYAEAEGAEIRRGWRADRIEVERERVVVSDGAGRTVESRVLVLACGASYRFHRALGLGVPDVSMQSAQLETPFPVSPQVQVRLGREVAPSGFAWLVSFDRRGSPFARIGVMCESGGREYFEAFVADLCREVGVDITSLPEPRRKLLPLAPVSRTYGDRVIAVGDAAGLVKPTTGGGIYYGMISGALAADVLGPALDRNRLGAAELRRYEKLWRRRLGPEIRTSLAFRRIAERLDDQAINSLIELARVNGVVPLLQETASFNWHRKAVVSLLAHRAFRSIILRSLCP